MLQNRVKRSPTFRDWYPDPLPFVAVKRERFKVHRYRNVAGFFGTTIVLGQ